jgi:hypothetical protein
VQPTEKTTENTTQEGKLSASDGVRWLQPGRREKEKNTAGID